MELAFHERLELHELLMFKTICTTKSSTMQALVSDPELNRILAKDVEMSQRHLQELRAFVQPPSDSEKAGEITQ